MRPGRTSIPLLSKTTSPPAKTFFAIKVMGQRTPPRYGKSLNALEGTIPLKGHVQGSRSPPFDRIQIDPVLNHFPQRTQLTQLLDDLRNLNKGGFDLSLCRESSQTEADR